jgi:hypothetical protein
LKLEVFDFAKFDGLSNARTAISRKRCAQIDADSGPASRTEKSRMNSVGVALNACEKQFHQTLDANILGCLAETSTLRLVIREDYLSEDFQALWSE